MSYNRDLTSGGFKFKIRTIHLAIINEIVALPMLIQIGSQHSAVYRAENKTYRLVGREDSLCSLW